MKKELALFIATVFCLSTVLIPSTSAIGPIQPPVDTSTLYVGRVGFPSFADPARAYDTSSAELIFNAYDTLIVFGEPVLNAWGTWDVHEQYWAFSPSLATNVPSMTEVTLDLHGDAPINPTDPTGTLHTIPPNGTEYIFCGFAWVDNFPDGVLGHDDVVYISEWIGGIEQTCVTWQVISFDIGGNILHLHHWYYDFNIRTSPVISYVNELGVVVDTFDINDVMYSLERGLVQDQYGSPMWMFYKPLFDQMNSDPWVGNEMCLAYLIDDAFVVLPGNVLRINVGIAFPETAFKQIMCGTWGAIVSKEFSVSIGCWNGDLLTDSDANGIPDWWDGYGYVIIPRRTSRSPYDAVGNYRYVGTGPYRITLRDSVNRLVVLQRNALYWRGWPAPQRKAFLEYIEISYITDWASRRDAFIAGQLDICDVPRAYMGELLNAYGEPKYLEIKTIKKISPVLSMEAIHYTFTVDPSSAYIGTGSLPDGIPTDFFNNTHIRKAFSYAFNHTRYLAETWFGEAICRETPLIYGLVPDYYTKGPDPPRTYDIDYAKAEAELKAATTWGASVWDQGFYITLTYNSGNEQKRIACYYIRDFFGALSTYDGRSGSPFRVEVQEIDGPTYRTLLEEFKLPIWTIGWAADFADPDNFVRTYMHSLGSLSSFQNYTLDNGWDATRGLNNPTLNKDELIDLAVKTPDGPTRADLYADLDTIYLEDVPSFVVTQPIGRRWQKYWVKGWYYNVLYPSDYYYHQYKENAPWEDVSGLTPGVPDGVVNVRDYGWIFAHLGAKAPNPAGIPRYDPLWAPGTYGCGGCDVYSDRKVDIKDLNPAATHDVAITNVEPSKTSIGKGYIMTVNVTVENQGDYTETFNVTAYADSLPIGMQTLTLTSKSSTQTTFNWNTSSFAQNSYIIKATAETVEEETDTVDNTLSDGTVTVGVPCDVTGPTPGVPDGVCNMRDIGYFCSKFGTTPSSPGWDSNCDVTGPTPKVPDNIVNMRDIGEACSNFGNIDP